MATNRSSINSARSSSEEIDSADAGYNWNQDDITSNTGDSQVSENDWSAVNKKLRTHGLTQVKVQHPSDVSHVSTTTICLDANANKVARDNFLSLLADCDNRQTLVQELIVKNNQLKEELAKQTALTDKYFGKMKDLKIMLESSRSRVKELESEPDSKPSSFLPEEEQQKVYNTRSAMLAKIQQQDYKMQAMEKENGRLKEKVLNLSVQSDKRGERVNQVFQEFRRRTARAHHTMDDKLLDVIDTYERQIMGLQQELEVYRLGEPADQRAVDSVDDDVASFLSVPRTGEPSGNFKSLVKAYEKQIRELDRKVKKLEEEKDVVKLDADSRPEVKDYRVAQLRIKKLEKLLALHNITIPGEKPKNDPYKLKRKFSTKVEDLDFLPLDLCHQYLKDISSELTVRDLETVVPRIQRMSKDLNEVHRYEQFCHTVNDMVNSMSERTKRERQGSPKKMTLSSNTLNHLITVIENWKQDEEGLEELQLSMNRLAERFSPWLKIRLSGEPSVSKITGTVDNMIYDEGGNGKVGKEQAGRAVLENIVQHFQTLFDVPNVSGVYPRMNEIYTKLGEVHNVLNTLRNLLGLSKDAKSSAIVDSVGRLVTQHNSTTVQQLKTLLQTEDLDGIIRRLREHAEFFPAFNEVMNKLLDILDLRRMDQLIPAVRALKLLAN